MLFTLCSIEFCPQCSILLGPVQDLTRVAGVYPLSLHDDGGLEVELRALIGSMDELGCQTLRWREV